MTTTDPTAPATPGEALPEAVEDDLIVSYDDPEDVTDQIDHLRDSSDWAALHELATDLAHDLEVVKAALAARATDPAPATPPERQPGARTYELPAEPDGPLWYPDGTKFVRLPPPEVYRMHAHHWVRADQRATWHGGLSWRQLLGAAAHPLSTTPPAGTEPDENAGEQCRCIHPDLDPELGEEMCACGDALDEHDSTGRCQAVHTAPASATAVDPPAGTVHP